MKYFIFDTETTGLRRGSDDVIQLAYVVLNDDLAIIDVGNEYCNTDSQIHPKAFAVHHINRAFLQEHAGSVFLQDLIAKNKYFNDLDEDIMFIAYNIDFDLNMINCKLRRRGYRGVDFGTYVKSPNQVSNGRYHFCMMNELKALQKWPARKTLEDAKKEILSGIKDEDINKFYNELMEKTGAPKKEGVAYHDALYDALITSLLFVTVKEQL